MDEKAVSERLGEFSPSSDPGDPVYTIGNRRNQGNKQHHGWPVVETHFFYSRFYSHFLFLLFYWEEPHNLLYIVVVVIS